MIKSAVRKLIVDNAGLAAIIGTRVYPTRLPDKYTVPSLQIQLVASTPATMHDGVNGRVFETVLQINIIASSEAQAEDLQTKLVTLLDAVAARSVVLGSTTVNILSGFLDDAQDSLEEAFERESEVVKMLDFTFIWRI